MRSKLALLSCLFACSDGIPADPVPGPVCAGCQPEVGGETGDLGGEFTPCWGLVVREPVDAAQATALGFDVAELERRIAQPIDTALAWEASETRGGKPATGFDTMTRVTATVSSRRSYQHVRPDPQYCDGTTCRFPGMSVPEATCPRRLETDVDVHLETADGAIDVTLTGSAWRAIAGSEGEGAFFEPLVLLTTRAKLSDIHGTLRVHPDPGAKAYLPWLQLDVWLGPSSLYGEISPNVLLKHDDYTATQYHPLLGTFPPGGDNDMLDVDAGVRR
jgi:hypothetical protein